MTCVGYQAAIDAAKQAADAETAAAKAVDTKKNSSSNSSSKKDKKSSSSSSEVVEDAKVIDLELPIQLFSVHKQPYHS